MAASIRDRNSAIVYISKPTRDKLAVEEILGTGRLVNEEIKQNYNGTVARVGEIK
jgi:hypothetical protein